MKSILFRVGFGIGILSLLFWVGCTGNENKQEAPVAVPTAPAELPKEEVEAQLDIPTGPLSPEQINRKAYSEMVCRQYEVPILEDLPVIHDSANTQIRIAQEVAERAIALAYLGLWSESPDDPGVESFKVDYGVLDFLTPTEMAMVEKAVPEQQDLVNANWRYESFFVLMWALGKVEALPYPAEVCNLEIALVPLFAIPKEDFITSAQLRSTSEILDQADLIYRLDWAVVDARVNGQPVPGGLNNEVVMERHYALNWLVGYLNQDWDNVSTDT